MYICMYAYIRILTSAMADIPSANVCSLADDSLNRDSNDGDSMSSASAISFLLAVKISSSFSRSKSANRDMMLALC